jgi:hypothetical protein
MIPAKSALRRVLPSPLVVMGSSILDRSLPARRRRLRRWRRQQLTREGQARVAAELVEHNGPIVQGGPFAGLALPTSGSWGNLGPLLVGCYEEELHGVVEELIAARPQLIVNVGCAEGYYAIGLARRLPEATVYAFDIDENARQLTYHTARINGVEERVHLKGECTSETLGRIVTSETLLVVDCEGCELELLRPDRALSLRTATILVELHDALHPQISSRLLSRFSATHAIELVSYRRPLRKDYPALKDLCPADRIIAVDEMRPAEPYPTEWAVLRPLVRPRTAR